MGKVKLIIEISEEAYERHKAHRDIYKLSEAIANGIPYEAPPKNDWIPVKSAEDLPKDKMLWVTDVYGRVFELHFDMTEWFRRVDDVVAYKYKDKDPEAYDGADMRTVGTWLDYSDYCPSAHGYADEEVPEVRWRFECSKCGNRVFDTEYPPDKCPSCGSEMRGV